MTSPTQLTPLLSLFADDGDFTLRLDDSPLGKKLGPEIIRLLSGSGGRRLTILTPTDTKIFKLGGQSGSNPAPEPRGSTETGRVGPVRQEPDEPGDGVGIVDSPRRVESANHRAPARQRIQQDQSAPPDPEIAEEEAEEVQRVRAEEREAERLRRGMEAANRADPNLPLQEEEEELPQPRVRKRASRPEPSQSATTPCGRCYGAGQIDGGGVCPVCQGRQTVQLYGRRR